MGIEGCCAYPLNWEFVLHPRTLQYLSQWTKNWGVLIAGILFGGGWWFWVDACVVSPTKVPFDQYIPGIIATLALVMINMIRQEELQDADPFDDAGVCRPRLWLFISYVVSFASIVGAVWVMIEHYANNPEFITPAEKWPGVAGIFQVVFILGSALLLFVSRTSEDAAQYGGYGAF